MRWHCDWTALLEMGFTLKAGVTPTLKLSREEWKHRAEFSAEWGTEQKTNSTGAVSVPDAKTELEK